jgi:hypothetical protein
MPGRHILRVDIEDVDDQNPIRVAVMPAWIMLFRDILLECPLSPFNVAWSASCAALE